MKALMVNKYGKSEDVLEIKDVPRPEVGSKDVLIEVFASSLNPIDYKMQNGSLKGFMKLSFPYIMGFDLSGIIVETGSEVEKFKIGDEVFSRVDSRRFGTLAEFTAVDEGFVALKPENISHNEAASLPLVALTSYQCLFDIASLKSGEKVLIHAGSGGIGTVAIQLAKNAGAFVAVTTSTRNVEMVKDLGADMVIDYTKQNFEEEVKDYDVVFETLGGENQLKSYSVLKPGGFLVSIAGVPSGNWAKENGLPFPVRLMIKLMNRKNDKAAGKNKVNYKNMLMSPDGQQLSLIAGLVRENRLKAVIDKVFPFDKSVEAVRSIQSGRTRGKIVVKIRS